jgi:hypothetical protein
MANAGSLDKLGWEALAERATSESSPIARRLAFARLLEAMTAENAMEIREQLVAGGLGGEAWRDFNFSLGALIGREALDFAANSPERDMNDVVRGWAAADPQAALALLGNLPEDLRGSRNEIAANVVAGIATSDPSLATDVVFRLSAEGDDQAGRLMSLVARETLRSSGVDGAASWSRTLPDGDLKAAAMDQVASAYVRQDPQAAAQWVESVAAESYAARAVEEVGDGLARQDPVAAVDWLQALPTGQGQMSGLQSVFGDWEDRDPVAAGEYLMSMPQSAQRDSAISGFSRGYAWQDPQTAIAWAQDISDPALRQRTLTQAGQAYFRRDPESARNWLQSSGLPEEAQQEVLRSRRR